MRRTDPSAKSYKDVIALFAVAQQACWNPAYLSPDVATAQPSVNPLTIQFFSSAAAESGPYAPWVLTFAVPLGALIALSKYRGWRRQVMQENSATASLGPSP